MASHRPELGTRANADQRPTPVSFRERASRVSQEVYDLAERIEARHANRLAEGRPVSSVDREALEQIRDRAAETLEVLDAPTAAEQAVQLEAIHLEREFQNIQGR